MPSEVWKDDAVARAFVDARAARVPETRTQLAVLLHVLGARAAPPGRILDVGAGDAILLATLLDVFPTAGGVAVDFSPTMLEVARVRLAPLGDRATVVEGDLASPEWHAGIVGRFDAIVSGFAIHHLPDGRKRALYGEILDLLEPGGAFLNLEHVASASARVGTIADEAMIAHQHAARRSAGEDVDRDRVRREFQERPDRRANILAPVDEQCRWLVELGYVDVDCFWKWFELAVFGGFRADR